MILRPTSKVHSSVGEQRSPKPPAEVRFLLDLPSFVRCEAVHARRGSSSGGGIAGSNPATKPNGIWRSLVSASALGAEGRQFESDYPDHNLAPPRRTTTLTRERG